jgi:hypothetical protein
MTNQTIENINTCSIITIPNSVTKIKNFEFRGNPYLISLIIPNSVTSIGMRSFMGCSNLESVDIPDSVTHIEDGAFMNCTRLKSIIIPNSVTKIEEQAFQGCESLTTVVVPSSVINFEDRVFDGCTGLISAVVPGDHYSTLESEEGWGFVNCPNLKFLSVSTPNGYIIPLKGHLIPRPAPVVALRECYHDVLIPVFKTTSLYEFWKDAWFSSVDDFKVDDIILF